MKSEIISKLFLCMILQYLSGSNADDCPVKCSCQDGNTTIDCSGKGLLNVPTLPVNTKSVDLSYNSISNISKGDFKNLTELLTVNLTSNLISTVDDNSFSDNKNLQYLNLANNQLRQVPALAVKSLRTIILNGNVINRYPFRVFPSSWSNCISLTTIGLANNHFTGFPSTTFMHLANLPVKNIDLSSNKYLERFPFDPSLFMKLTALESLDLSFNSVTALDIHDALMPLLNQPVLKSLNIAGTNIGKLNADFFQGLTNLDYLNMSKSNLTSWNVKTFTQTPKLTTMDLSGNKITVINNSSYDNSFNGIEKSLKNVKLGNNPFHCYCSLMWLRELMNSKTLNILDQGDMKCAEPESMKGRKVLSLDKENCESVTTTSKPFTSTTPIPTTTTIEPNTTTSHVPTTTSLKPNTTTTLQPNTTTSHVPTTTTLQPNTTTSHVPTTTSLKPNTTTSYVPTTTTLQPNITTSHTPVTTSSSNSTVNPTTLPPGGTGGFPGWGIALIVLAIVGLIIAGFFSYRHWRRRQMDDEARLPIIGDPVA